MCFRNAINDVRSCDEQFARRALAGKCFYQPYFGCREFPAFFEPIDEGRSEPAPVTLDLDLGWMLYDVFDLNRANDDTVKPCISVFHAQIFKGVMEVPDYRDAAVRRGWEE
jgi:CRISPR-associated protein Cas5d